MSEKENVIVEITESLDENTETQDKKDMDENIDELLGGTLSPDEEK